MTPEFYSIASFTTLTLVTGASLIKAVQLELDNRDLKAENRKLHDAFEKAVADSDVGALCVSYNKKLAHLQSKYAFALQMGTKWKKSAKIAIDLYAGSLQRNVELKRENKALLIELRGQQELAADIALDAIEAGVYDKPGSDVVALAEAERKASQQRALEFPDAEMSEMYDPANASLN